MLIVPCVTDAGVVVVVVEPTLATPGDAEPFPQAAKSIATSASASPTPAASSLLV
ncbi:MAG: hypothetical protein WCF24_05330 [Acidimicrobiales bacterium]